MMFAFRAKRKEFSVNLPRGSPGRDELIGYFKIAKSYEKPPLLPETT